MNDAELRPDEQQRLSSLLGRAADGLDVRSAPEFVPIPSGRARRPWLVAAALIAVAAVGSTWWAVGRDGDEAVNLVDRLDVPLIRDVIEEDGLWRLPAADSELELIEVDVAVGEGGDRMIAVDDVAAPTMWIAVIAGEPNSSLPDDRLVAPPGEVPLTRGAGVNLVTSGDSSPTGSSWFDVSLIEAKLDSDDERRLTVAAGGIPDQRVFDLLTDMVERFDPPDGPWQVFTALESLSLPEEFVHELVPLPQHLVMTVETPDRTRAMFSLTESGLGPQLASLLQRLSLEAEVGFDRRGTPSAIGSTPRPDIGPGAFTMGPTGTEWLVVFSRDGVSINVQGLATADLPRGDPISVEQQLGLINQLRSVSEEEFRDEVERRGAWTSEEVLCLAAWCGPDD